MHKKQEATSVQNGLKEKISHQIIDQIISASTI
jgi:hypothetical protein